MRLCYDDILCMCVTSMCVSYRIFDSQSNFGLLDQMGADA